MRGTSDRSNGSPGAGQASGAGAAAGTEAPGNRRLPSIRYGRGPLETQALLLAEIDRLLDAAAGILLHPPIRIVVPSKSLRLHLLAVLARHRGRPVAGVECHTLHALAESVVREAGLPAPSPVDLFPVFARRLAARDPVLRRSLGHLRDGYGTVLGSVRDLLDAGFGPAHLEAVEEALRDALEGGEASRGSVDRAASVARIAAAAAGGLEGEHLGRTSTLLTAAAELVRHDGSAMPETQALFVYGFSDATGVATDFLEALLARAAGLALLDLPPDPADPRHTDSGVVFGRRFAERLENIAGEIVGPPEPPCPTPEVLLVAAPGRVAEVRAAADAILDLLEGGAEPERIGLVARDLAAYRLPVRTHLTRAGVPFSGVGARGPLSPAGRRIRALLELLVQRRQSPVERWLDARAVGFAGVDRYELRLALHALGAGRLEEAAALRLDDRVRERGFPLPVRRGFLSDSDADGDEPDGDSMSLRRRRIPAAALSEAIAAAGRLLARLPEGSERRPLAERLAELRRTIHEDLAWSPDDRASRSVEDALARGLERLPGELEFDPQELALLLEDELQESGGEELGGAGGGVQVLDVTEARHRTFDHLFVLGLNRGEFPREVREDPILTEPVRRVLGVQGHGVLPDLATKRQGHDEERFLFAQLASAAPTVTLSWRRSDDSGTELTPSPLVERIRLSEDRAGSPGRDPRIVGSIFEPDDGDQTRITLRLHTAVEHATAAGLRRAPGAAGLVQLRRVFALALGEATAEPGSRPATPPAELARARLDAIREWDGGLELRGRLGPLFGFTGTTRPGDPRHRGEIWVTTLEALHRCPWKAFLERLLKLEPLPDPLEALPGIDRLLIGSLVHRAAEAIVTRSAPPSEVAEGALDAALRLQATRVTWPEPEALEALVGKAAEEIVREEGLALPGFARVLARAGLPFLERLRRSDWPDDASGPTVLAAEVSGRWPLDGRDPGLELRFRADRVDRIGDGYRLSDYKTGSRVLSTAAKPETRQAHLLREVGRGLALQAALYAGAAAAASGHRAIGRYLYLDPDLEVDEEKREAIADSADTDLAATFDSAVSTGVEAWQSGVFVPRLTEVAKDEEPRTCRWCDVAQACVRGDSGLRGRLRTWLDDDTSGEATGQPDSEPLAVLGRLWWQGSERPS